VPSTMRVTSNISAVWKSLDLAKIHRSWCSLKSHHGRARCSNIEAHFGRARDLLHDLEQGVARARPFGRRCSHYRAAQSDIRSAHGRRRHRTLGPAGGLTLTAQVAHDCQGRIDKGCRSPKAEAFCIRRRRAGAPRRLVPRTAHCLDVSSARSSPAERPSAVAFTPHF